MLINYNKTLRYDFGSSQLLLKRRCGIIISKMSSAIIDLTLQCDRVIKEMSIIAHDGPSAFILKHYVFLPPTTLNKGDTFQSRYCRMNIHGLAWEDGNTPYNKIPEILQDATKGIKFLYAKGLEKCAILREFLPNNRMIHDLGQFNCPKLTALHGSSSSSPSLGNPCSTHEKAGQLYYSSCSMVKLQALSNWFSSNKMQTNLLDTVPRLLTFKGTKMSIDPSVLVKRGFYRNPFCKDSICCV